MRVGLVCPYDMSRPGGVQAQVRGLRSVLEDLGDEVTILAPGLDGGPGEVDLGRTVVVPGNGSMVPLSVDPRVGSIIEEAARDLEVLHVHEPFMPTVSVAALRVGTPVVATFHAAPGAIGVGLYSLAGARIGKLLGKNVKVVTAVSDTAAAPLHESLEVEIVPNGVDMANFVGDIERVPGRVSYLGRDERRKGLDVLLEAWPTVVAAIPGAELVVMGAERDTDSIRWMGQVDDRTKSEVLQSSQIYVAPNLGGESFGIVLVEAMSAGAAVVASDLPAFRDVAGEAARYFEIGDSLRLASILVELLADGDAVATMSSTGRDLAANFDWARVAASYRETYELALS